VKEIVVLVSSCSHFANELSWGFLMHLTRFLICKLLDYFVKSSYLSCHLHKKGEKLGKVKVLNLLSGFLVRK